MLFKIGEKMPKMGACQMSPSWSSAVPKPCQLFRSRVLALVTWMLAESRPSNLLVGLTRSPMSKWKLQLVTSVVKRKGVLPRGSGEEGVAVQRALVEVAEDVGDGERVGDPMGIGFDAGEIEPAPVETAAVDFEVHVRIVAVARVERAVEADGGRIKEMVVLDGPRGLGADHGGYGERRENGKDVGEENAVGSEIERDGVGGAVAVAARDVYLGEVERLVGDDDVGAGVGVGLAAVAEIADRAARGNGGVFEVGPVAAEGRVEGRRLGNLGETKKVLRAFAEQRRKVERLNLAAGVAAKLLRDEMRGDVPGDAAFAAADGEGREAEELIGDREGGGED